MVTILKVSNSFRWSLYKPKNGKTIKIKSFPLQSGAEGVGSWK
jgi:hypothetical protein